MPEPTLPPTAPPTTSTATSTNSMFDATSTSQDISYVKSQCANNTTVPPSMSSLCCDTSASFVEVCVGFANAIASSSSVETKWVVSSLSVVGKRGGNSPLPPFNLSPWRTLAFSRIDIRSVDVGSLVASSLNYTALTSLYVVRPSTTTYTNCLTLASWNRHVIGCQLPSLDIPSPSTLQHIDLSLNHMTSFPGSLFQTSSLVSVNLTGNNFPKSIAVVAQACIHLQMLSTTSVLSGVAIQCPTACPAVATCVSVELPITAASVATSNNAVTDEDTSSPILVVAAAVAVLLLVIAVIVCCRRRILVREQRRQQLSTVSHHFMLTRAPSQSTRDSDNSFVFLDTGRADIVLLDHSTATTAMPRPSPQTTSTGIDDDDDDTNVLLASARQLSRAFSKSLRPREGVGGIINKPPLPPPPSLHALPIASCLPILPASDILMTSPLAHGSSMWALKYLDHAYAGKRVPTFGMSSDELQAFLSTVNMLATRVVHPNVVALVGVVHLPDNDVCVVAEWMERGSLALLLHHETPSRSRPAVLHLTWADKVQLAWEVASALAFVHSQPKFKRPGPWTTRNVLVCSAGHARLNVLDEMDQGGGAAAGWPAGYTYGHHTVAYDAPEVVAHNCARSSSSDVYTLGVVLGEIATRCLPYCQWVATHGHVATDVRIVQNLEKSPVVTPHGDRFKHDLVPTGFQALVANCLQRDVLKRPLAVNVADELSAMIAIPTP
ncbi:serine/threonine protein kinase, variant 1 [Aphanomyces astaci]|uniref:Serine/threonine protein kinase, variant 1 n=2 Tax=Aphanomyces astaci TaxID=112090 RepID=W4GPK3_APHAT|nr:serine/threonine protein kinase, variant 1 [Aphanomyces astaci]ETV81655.1 serine/threonine protein kinase, variant 1 [Aphanomyces astaci]|eukprot:XP_009828392.1 serine/threonine protein kinase, variant 1 [Aphanomyces astaci]